jgi:hypothetical protein
LNDDCFSYFNNVKVSFGEFLKSPDLEQELIELFQTEYNSIEEDFRSDPDVKAELFQRLEELKEKLWEFADKRRDDAESERVSIIEDRWVEDRSFNLANILVSLIQAETDKFLKTRQLVLDIYKNSKEMPMVDIPKNEIKLAFVASTAPPPIEVGNALISISEQIASQRRDNSHTQVKETKAASKEQTKEKKEKITSASTQKNAKQADAKAAPSAAVEKENLTLPDPESSNFPDVNAAIDFVLQLLKSPEYSLDQLYETHIINSPINLVVDPKSVIPNPVPVPVPVPEVVEKVDRPPPNQAARIIELEEELFKERLEVIRRVVSGHFKELRKKGLEVYSKLDDWIGQRYKAEIDSARDLVLFIKDAIEKEMKLPNLIYIENEQLHLDYSTLIFKPQEPPRPESPTEKLRIHSFN